MVYTMLIQESEYAALFTLCLVFGVCYPVGMKWVKSARGAQGQGQR